MVAEFNTLFPEIKFGLTLLDIKSAIMYESCGASDEELFCFFTSLDCHFIHSVSSGPMYRLVLGMGQFALVYVGCGLCRFVSDAYWEEVEKNNKIIK